MDKILAMKQKRAELIKKMRAMVEAATSATRDFNDDEKANYEQLLWLITLFVKKSCVLWKVICLLLA